MMCLSGCRLTCAWCYQAAVILRCDWHYQGGQGKGKGQEEDMDLQGQADRPAQG